MNDEEAVSSLRFYLPQTHNDKRLPTNAQLKHKN